MFSETKKTTTDFQSSIKINALLSCFFYAKRLNYIKISCKRILMSLHFGKVMSNCNLII